MLCYRCEYRAKYLEGGTKPRFECGDIKSSKVICYMYVPCKPISLVKANKDDPRMEHGGPMLGCRMRGERLMEHDEFYLDVKGSFLYWKPREV